MDLVYCRAISFFTIASLFVMLDRISLLSLTFAAGISHNTLALFYERRKIAHLFKNWRKHALLLAGLTALLVTCWWKIDPALYIGLAFHVIATEIYLSSHRLTKSWLTIPRITLHFAVYFILTQEDHYLLQMSFDQMTPKIVLFISYLVYLLFAIFQWKRINKVEIWYDLTIMLAGVSGLFTSVKVSEIAAYHILFWFLYPMIIMNRRQRSFYFSASAVLFLFGLIFSPLLPLARIELTAEEMTYTTFYYGIFHFITSLILTNSTPKWLRINVANTVKS